MSPYQLLISALLESCDVADAGLTSTFLVALVKAGVVGNAVCVTS